MIPMLVGGDNCIVTLPLGGGTESDGLKVLPGLSFGDGKGRGSHQFSHFRLLVSAESCGSASVHGLFVILEIPRQCCALVHSPPVRQIIAAVTDICGAPARTIAPPFCRNRIRTFRTCT